jgi:hypothetical protein
VFALPFLCSPVRFLPGSLGWWQQRTTIPLTRTVNPSACVRIGGECSHSYPGTTVGGIGGFTTPGSLQLCGVPKGGGGGERTGRHVKSKLQRTASFIVVESLDVAPEHKHLCPLCCLDTAERIARITLSCLSLIARCQNSKSGRYHLT